MYSSKMCAINIQERKATSKITNHIINEVKNININKEVIILCVGTDRSTGDSLAPWVGTFLKNKVKEIKVYGTIDSPVHAKNLKETYNDILDAYDSPYIIAIDSCLGRLKNVGNINVYRDSLKPGASMNKGLPEVGNMAITGTVNISGNHMQNYFVLQNTRLSLVVEMASVIAHALENIDERIYKEQIKQDTEEKQKYKIYRDKGLTFA